jgi:cation diffusion facilitator CzcD-associated flavoprotein CzcO
MTATSSADAVVIGAGFSGLYMGYRLRDHLGLDVRVIEAGDNVGGTWNWTRYPGARCDSESFVYCYSFCEDLLQQWQWSGKYPEQAEILSYLEHVADRFDLRRSIEFNARVTSAKYDEGTARWFVTTDQGETVSAQFLITGIGHLAICRYVPNFPGLDRFEGEWYHTGGWPREGVDLRGKRVGVIGTGSSGVQTIPVIAEQAAQLTVFQRTPQYSIPARHETVDDAFWKEVKANYEEIFEGARNSAGGFPWQHNGRRAMDVSEEERQAVYEALWAEGGLKFAFGSFRDVSYDLAANQTVSDFMRSKIREVVKDPETREKLIPQHPFLSRRPIVDTNYYETYNRDNVVLVDVKSSPIEEITPGGVRTSDREYALDVLVFATGYDAVTGPYFNIDLRGRNDATLTTQWAAGPKSYLGLQTVNFPNMFMITGPGSTLGNLPLTIETHVDWITDCIASMRRDGVLSIEPSAEAEDEWGEHVEQALEHSLIRMADSWINGSNIPGKARVPLIYFGHFGKYRRLLGEVAKEGYRGFEFDSLAAKQPA